MLLYYYKERACRVNTVAWMVGKRLISYLKIIFFSLWDTLLQTCSGSSCFFNFAPLPTFFFFFKMAFLLLQCNRLRITVTQKMKVFYVSSVMVLQPNEEYFCFTDNGNTRRNLQEPCKLQQPAVYPFYSPCCSFHFICSCSYTNF